MSLAEYLREDPSCSALAEGAIHAVAPLLEDPDPAPTLERLEGWVVELAGRMPLPWNLHAALDTLNHFLFHEVGLTGDRASYDDPDNAALPKVLLRKKGLPVALSILWIDVARRLGFDAVGIPLPGHFVVAHRTDLGALYFDPFNGGRPIGEETAARLVRSATTGRVVFDPSMLKPASHRDILARLVRNLRIHFSRTEAWNEAYWCATHLVLLRPEDSSPLRDRALIQLRRGNLMEALADLEQALRLMPQPDPILEAELQRFRPQ